MNRWIERLLNLAVRPEPPVPIGILGDNARYFSALPKGATVCIKVSSAHAVPYPFAVSGAFVARVVAEIHAANPGLRLLLTEGGVGRQSVQAMAEHNGLVSIPNAEFIDAEASATVFVANPNPTPHREEGFWLPTHWVEADKRVLLTTCKLRSHHFQRWYSGGTRNLIGLLPRARYKLSTSRRDMRSALHQRGMDAMVADLYTTTGRDVLTILDGRLLARQDEHFPMRFTRALGKILIMADPVQADQAMVNMLGLPFIPPYLALIAKDCERSLSKLDIQGQSLSTGSLVPWRDTMEIQSGRKNIASRVAEWTTNYEENTPPS